MNKKPIKSPDDRPVLQALKSAALVLPGLMASPAQAQTVDSGTGTISFQYSRYQEGKRNLNAVRSDLKPITVDTLNGNGTFVVNDRLKLSFSYTQDTWSGATPISTIPLAATAAGNRPFERTLSTGEVVSGASPFVNGAVTLDRDLNPVSINAQGDRVVDPRSVLVLSSASPETRKQGDFGLAYEWDEATLNLGGGLSHERDYDSVYGRASGQFDFKQKMTSIKWGASYTSSRQSAVLDHDTLGFVTNLGYADRLEVRDQLVILEGDRRDWTSSLGITQVLGKNSLATFDFGYTRSSGFLENPYKAVTTIFIDPERVSPDPEALLNGNLRALLEQRPGLRNQFAFSSKLVQYIQPLDAAWHVNYKFSFDDWGIQSHTLESDWVQPLTSGWTITPRIRYYSQGSADFYRPYLVTNQAFVKVSDDGNGESVITTFDFNKLPKNFSSDHRLSDFGALSGGVTLNKQFARGIELEAGFEYYTRASSLKLGGGGTSGFADFDYYVANAAIKLDMDAIRFNRSQHDHHNAAADPAGQHQHNPSPLPAGIMFGHMLDKAGDFMMGYRFMYNRQAGDIRHGTNNASDSEIVNAGCGTGLCTFAPAYMEMRMHMLDIMYAPTNWLNLMLMPQFMDMEMNLRELEDRPPPVPGAHEHVGTPHNTGAIGDVIAMSLLRLVALPGHRLHLGAGFSAPTGKTGLKLRRVARIEGGLIHFDMQLGSGTWDFLPNLTYSGNTDRWYWGAQLSGTKRMERRNDSGYRLGDIFQGTTWGGAHLTEWLSASVRGQYRHQGKIQGDFNSFNARIGPMDFPGNQGGQFWDIGFGINASVPKGRFSGNHFSVEWLQPVRQDFNGFQLERKGTLNATWAYHF
ncbi:MAG: DUF3570 domain-containing protein [Nitrosomonas sp.]|nr:DUF3570 domain-containing protein [Nitrosomonas sp.]